jgi:hypothetical protein
MRRFIIGLTCGVVISLSSVVYASDSIQALLFPANFKINGQIKELSSEYSILNYKGHVYFPIRFIAEDMGGKVSYDSDSQTISVNTKVTGLANGSLNVNQIKTLLKISITESEIKKIFGVHYTELTGTPPEAGVVEEFKSWRFDLGVDEGYTVENNTGHDGWTDNSGVESDKIHAQLLLTWNKTQIKNIILFYKGEDKKLHYYTVSEDSTTKDMQY